MCTVPAPRSRAAPAHQGYGFGLPISHIPLMAAVTPYCLRGPNSHQAQTTTALKVCPCPSPFTAIPGINKLYPTCQIKVNWTTAMLHLHTVCIPPGTAELNSRHRNHVALKTSNIGSLALDQTSLPVPHFFHKFTKHLLCAKHCLCPVERTVSKAKSPSSGGLGP